MPIPAFVPVGRLLETLGGQVGADGQVVGLGVIELSGEDEEGIGEVVMGIEGKK